MSVASAKIPITLVVGIVCLLGGVALGMVVMGLVDERLKKDILGEDAAAKSGENTDKGPAPTGGSPPAGGGKKGKGGGKGGFGKPNPRMQLAQLVNKLDVLTKKPLTVQLSDEEKQKVKEQLAGIDEKDDLSEEDAQAKLNELLKLLAPYRETLVAAGYFWPGGGPPGGGGGGGPPGGMPPGMNVGGGMGPPVTNPFRAGDNNDRLKSLRTTLEK